MNLIQGKSNQFLREAILEGSIEKARRYLTLKIGKADVGALTEVRSLRLQQSRCTISNAHETSRCSV
jgi:hypothetical protein